MLLALLLIGYVNVYWSVPTVEHFQNGDQVVTCPKWPAGYVLLGVFPEGLTPRQHQMEEDAKPACYHYEKIEKDQVAGVIAKVSAQRE
jgi:hypothetical protein